jgi:peptidoglycan/xylan/chitin deacetylase (PgdA/CDA1 family)
MLMSSPPAPILRILTYHKVSSRRELGVQTVSPCRFVAHLNTLRTSGFAGLTLEAIGRILSGAETAPSRGVHLTFDDGYADFAEVAWEYCRGAGFPATVFPLSGFIGSKNVWDRSFPRTRHLDWTLLEALVRDGVAVGAHTVTHPFLARIRPDDALKEMRDSKRLLEDRLGVSVTALAYPYGNYSPDVMSLAQEAGFEFALTLDPRRPFEETNRYALPRVAVYALDRDANFRAKLGLRGYRAWHWECTKNYWMNRCAYANLLFSS